MNPATTQKLAVLVTGAVILIAMVVWVESQGSTAIRQSIVEDVAVLNAELADRPAPDWTLQSLEGEPVSLASLKGKVVFLNFWASWCAPCREEMPSMEELARKYQGRDLVMIAATQDDDMGALDGFLKRFMPEGRPVMRIVRDPGGEMAKAYGTQLLPETYIINREGRVVARFVNKYDWMRPEVDRLIERLLRE